MQDFENCNKTAVAQRNFCQKNFDAYNLITNTELVIQSKSQDLFQSQNNVQSVHPEQTHNRINVHATVELLRQPNKVLPLINDTITEFINIGNLCLVNFSCITAQTL